MQLHFLWPKMQGNQMVRLSGWDLGYFVNLSLHFTSFVSMRAWGSLWKFQMLFLLPNIMRN